MRDRERERGFTLAELLIVVAILAVLVMVAVPLFMAQLEKSREATDLANVRAAYAEVMAAAIAGDTHSVDYADGVYSKTVALVQQQDDWQTSTPVTVGSIYSTDTGRWFGYPGADGECTVYYCDKAYTTAGGNSVVSGKAFEWTGGSAATSAAAKIYSLIEGLDGEAKCWNSVNGTMKVGSGQSNRATLNAAPVPISAGQTVTVTIGDGYKSGVFLMKWDAEAGGYVQVVNTGWKTGTYTITADEDCYLAINVGKNDNTVISMSEAKQNVTYTVSGTAATTAGMTESPLISDASLCTLKTSYYNSAADGTSTNQATGKGHYAVQKSSPNRFTVSSVSVSGGDVLHIGDIASAGLSIGVFYTQEDGTVGYDSGWMTSSGNVVIPDDGYVCVNVIRIDGKTPTSEDVEALSQLLTLYQ